MPTSVCSRLVGTVERSRTDSGAPSQRAYAGCAEEHQANEAPRVVAVTSYNGSLYLSLKPKFKTLI